MASSSKSSVLHESNFYAAVRVIFLKFRTDYVATLIKIVLPCFKIYLKLHSISYQC